MGGEVSWVEWWGGEGGERGWRGLGKRVKVG